MHISGNTILVTGGTSGIGRALAEALHDRGNRVIVTGRRRSRLDEIVAERPGMIGRLLDVNDPAAVDAFARAIVAEFPNLNVLINNAGISRSEDLVEDFEVATAKAMIDTNIVAVLQLTAALLPTLRAREHATIITTTSGLAFVPLGNYATYCATKAFLHSWLQSLRTQLRATSVEVLELAPPYVQTELGGAAQLTDPAAMPLDAYITEVMAILDGPAPPRGEVLVDRVKQMRTAERDGRYEELYAMMNPV
jgi:uncharacterized oxidoreductase